MHPITPRVDRDEIVRTITNFYTFLTKLHVPESALKLPPPGGWPNITSETTKNFNKSRSVVDLIKHLPYIDEKDAREMITYIQYKCDVVDWSARTAEDFTREGAERFPTAEMGIRFWIDEIEGERKKRDETRRNDDKCDGDNGDDHDNDAESDGWGEDWEYFSAGEDPEINDRKNLIGIAQGYESGGREFTLDVFKGVVYDDMIRCSFLGGSYVEDFFQDLQAKFENLELVPIRGEMLEAGWDDDEVNEYREIYRSHGWPGDGFRKEEALAAVEMVRQRIELEEEG